MERGPRLTVGSVVSALTTLAALGGYVLLVGAIVAWVNVDDFGVPNLGVVADMPRNELFGLGLETIAVWLLLAVAFTVVLVGAGSVDLDNPIPVFAMFAAAVLVVVVGFALGQIGPLGWRIVAWVLFAAVLGGVIAFLHREGLLDDLWPSGGSLLPLDADTLRTLSRRLAPLSALIAGLGIGAALGLLLIKRGRFPGGDLSAVGSVAAGVWAAGESVWRRKQRQEITDDELRIKHGEFAVPRGEAGATSATRELEDHVRREREAIAVRREGKEDLLRRSLRRSAVAIALLAALLGAGAILARGTHTFWRARVTMTNGTCVAGTLLVRGSDEILLAGGEHPQNPLRLVHLPSSEVSSVQVIGPGGKARPLRVATCFDAANRKPPHELAPSPLAGKSGAEAKPPGGSGDGSVVIEKGGHTMVVRGPEGRPGPEGREGRAGKQGVEGKAGAPGPEGREGKQGPEGEQGPSGAAGPRGPQGQRGRVGASGPRGPRGRPGPRGERGPPGPSEAEDGS
jgi:hypothetical protein